MGSGFLVGIASAAFILFASPAAAQLPAEPVFHLALDAAEGRIQPVVGLQRIPWTLTYGCDAVLTAGQEPPVVHLTPEAHDPWVVVEALPNQVILEAGPQACPLGETRTAEGTLAVRLTREAPAYVETTVGIGARMLVDDKAFESQNETTVVPEFYGILSATADQAIVKVAPGNEVMFEISIANYGNADVVVRVAVTGPVEEFQTQYPNETAVGSPYHDNALADQTVVPLVLTAPGGGLYQNKVHTFDFAITSVSERERDVEGDRAQLSLLVRVQGFAGEEGALPGPGPGVLGLALAAGLLLVRRGRDLR